MNERAALIEAICAAARDWLQDECDARDRAIDQTLHESNRFTEEAIVFAVNQQMSLLTADAIHRWIDGYSAKRARRIGVLNAGNIPLVGVQDWLAVCLMGHAYRGVLSSKSPHLLPAFVAEVTNRCSGVDSRFVPFEDLWGQVEALIASGSDDTMSSIREACEAHGMEAGQCLLRGHRFSAAVLDGNESEEERLNLAEDTLLHEGMGCRNVAVLWAPESLAPDDYLQSFAVFRGVFPAHSRTPGSLKMKKAFLEAIGASHAYGDGLEFLISKGPPEPQEPCHIRWTPYRALEEVESWLVHERENIQLVLASDRLKSKLKTKVSVECFGNAQRPSLDWKPDDVDTLSFLASL